MNFRVKIRDRLDQLCLHSNPWLEKRGKKKEVTYHLSRSAVADCGEGSVYPGMDDRSGTMACLDSRGNGRPRFAG